LYASIRTSAYTAIGRIGTDGENRGGEGQDIPLSKIKFKGEKKG